jgi:hypothetical protein
MSDRRRLEILERMLGRLTGKAPAVPAEPAAESGAPVAAEPAAAAPRNRRLQILRAMLARLER